MPFRTFTGYLNSQLFGSQNPSVGSTFDTTTAKIQILMQDGDGDTVVEGDANGGSTSTESSEDPQDDQFVFIQDGSGTVLADGEPFYLELSFEFTVGGQTFTGYHFEDENGLDFTILPPDVPDGIATIDSRTFQPTDEEVDYSALSSGDEDFQDADFTNLDLRGDDTIIAGDGDDVIEGGIGGDTIDAGDGDDVVFGDLPPLINGELDSDQGPGGFSFGTVEGWFNTGSGGNIERWGDGFNGTTTSDGSSYIELDVNTGGGLDHLQTNIDLAEGVEYVLTIDAAARPGGGFGDSFEITQNGVVIATVTPTSVGTFTTTTVTIIGEAGFDTIGFRELSGEDNSLGILLDNLTINLSDASLNTLNLNDIIDGGAGNDTIFGQEGDDRITGGIGDDLLSGGIGDDLFVLADGSGNDIITDFEIGSDLLDVSLLNDADGNPVNTGDVTVTSDGEGGSILTFENGEQVILRGIDPDDLDTPAELNEIGIPCFASGTLIETIAGPAPVEQLSPGDRIKVGCGTFVPLRLNLNRQIPHAELVQNDRLAPVRIAAGALGAGLPSRDLWVSRQHRMLVNSPIAQRMFSTREALIAAVRLVGLPGIKIDTQRRNLSYHHLVFDNHQIVYAEDAPSESFLTGPQGIKSLSIAARAELFTIFPDLKSGYEGMNPVHTIPPNKQQKTFAARHLKNAKPLLEQAFM